MKTLYIVCPSLQPLDSGYTLQQLPIVWMRKKEGREIRESVQTLAHSFGGGNENLLGNVQNQGLVEGKSGIVETGCAFLKGPAIGVKGSFKNLLPIEEHVYVSS